MKQQQDTDLSRKILGSAAGRRILERVSPIYGNARIGLWLFQVIGKELDELKEWVTQIGSQAYPQSVTWSMDIWEQQYGITPDLEKSLNERRGVLIAAVRERAPMTPYKLQQTVSALTGGVDVRIWENIAPNTFGIYLNTIPSHVNENAIRNVVNRCKPAHLIYEIGYEQSIVSGNFWGAMVRTAKKLEIRQVN